MKDQVTNSGLNPSFPSVMRKNLKVRNWDKVQS